MKWFIDENGWPKSATVSASEWRSLIHENTWSEEQIQTSDLDLEDIFDETLLPFERNPKLEEKAYSRKVIPIMENQSHSNSSLILGLQQPYPKLFSFIEHRCQNKFTRNELVCEVPSSNLRFQCDYKKDAIQTPDSIPKPFDMRNRSDGIVIRDSMDMDDYLEPLSPDSPLLKSSETVLHELDSTDLDPEALMDEQRAIEADLQAQQLIDPATRLLQASNAIPEDLKSGLPLGDTSIPMLADKGKKPLEQEPKTRARKRQASLSKQEPRKKQHSEEARVEAASPKWLPADK
ncbi:hypothetical protein LINGRAHAP2_LOCUS34884 [Linum grandiflorum]